jgi:hypothetical protein
MDREAEVSKLLNELHVSFLKGNEHDEGDLLYYRINYRLVDTFGMTKEEAERSHSAYHVDNPRQFSRGYCDKCCRIVTIIPIIYGIQTNDIEKMRVAESERRLIIGNTGIIREGAKVAMFGCSECRNPLPRYGII